MDSKSTTGLTPIKQALLEIRDLRGRLAACEGQTAEPVAIVGMGMRLPGGVTDAAGFWRLLAQGEEAITDVPADRWLPIRPDATDSQTSRGGFLERVYDFDAEFFHISPREAESLDPQHRLLLEVAWEALENSGIPPESLAGTQTGVFVGMSNSDYGRRLLADPLAVDAHSSLNAWSLAAGRLAYLLNIHGPALTLDTACSSSLAALHLACRSLRSGECSTALVAASNLILSPELNIAFAKTGMLAPDGHCKTFDQSADGYVRSEGCACLLLKPLRKAVEAGDPVLAVVRGSALNQDGRSAGLTAPNGTAQEAVIREALRDAGVAPESVDYVEAHGTGTALGDPIELEALARAYGRGRSGPLQIGSVKTNLGHLEAAAGLAGVLKIVLALQHGQLPPHLHYREGNRHLNWKELPLAVTSSAVEWSRKDRPRRAGVSSFGFSGTNAHVILDEAPLQDVSPSKGPNDSLEVLCLSAATEPALRQLASLYVSKLLEEDCCFADVCFTANVGRSHHPYRLSIVAPSGQEAAGRLSKWLESGEAEWLTAGRVPDERFNTAFLFGGRMQWDAEAVALWRDQFPAFDNSFRECESVLEAHGKPEEGGTMPPNGHELAVAYALAKLWTSFGVTAGVVLGDHLGEYCAAVVAGLLSLPDAFQMVGQGRLGATGAVSLQRGQATIVSSVTGQVENERMRQQAYWRDRPAEAPKFAEGLEAITQRGRTVFLAFGDGLIGLGSQEILSVSPADSRSPLRQVLEGLRWLYSRGIAIDWKGVYSGRSQKIVTLPTYPFQRRTFRVGKEPAAELVEAREAFWLAARSAAERQAEIGPLGWNLQQYPLKWECLEELTRAHIENTLAVCGVFGYAGETATVDSILTRCGFQSNHRGLMERWMGHLVALGKLSEREGVYVCLRPLGFVDLAPYWQKTAAVLTDDPAALAYLRQCSAVLVEVLRGQKSALETLFPDGSFAMAEHFYETSQQARYLNPIVAAAVSHGAQALPSRTGVRTMEIGAGTGGTTSAILKQLDAKAAEYWFTDLSDLFLARAARKFQEFSFVRFAKFDLDQPCAAQNIPRQSFDVVLLANVLHATRDLRRSLAGIKDLLVPGGLLILLESTTHFGWFDITTGLIEGWGTYEDERRHDHPLLSAPDWVRLLNESGFSGAQQFPPEGSLAETVGQHVILARTNGSRSPSTIGTSTVDRAPWKSVTSQPEGDEQFTGLAVAVEQAKPEERFSLVFEYVCACLRKVFRLDASQALEERSRFTDLGMDSLLALELRTVLGKHLPVETMPASVAFDSGTPGSLTTAVLEFLFPAAPPSKPANGRWPGETALTAEDLDRLSEEEVEQMLVKRLQGQGLN